MDLPGGGCRHANGTCWAMAARPPIREEVTTHPDSCMETHYAYGARAGIWRILDAFAKHDMRATFSACGRAVAHSPQLVREPHQAEPEISAHGWRWESHANMPESTEHAAIAAIRDATGGRPVGWLLRETGAKMLSIGLHLRIIGRPGRMRALADILAHVAKTPGIWVAPRREIAAHWRKRAQELP